MRATVAAATVALCMAAGTRRAHADMRLGAQAAVALTTIEQSGSAHLLTFDDRPMVRAAAGGVVDLRGGGRVGVRLEPLYAKKGSRYMDPSCPCLRPVGYVPKDNDLRLSYLELPILLIVSLGQGRWRPYALAGPAVSRLVGARVTRDGQEYDAIRDLKKWDVGLSAGVGLGRSAGGARPFAEARYTVGLLALDGWSRRNQAAQVLLGLTLATAR